MKTFEECFSEIQSDMVSICLEYVENKVEEVFIYCSYEPTIYVFDVFYKIKGKIVHKHQLNKVKSDVNYELYDVSRERQKSLLKRGNKDLKQIHQVCVKFNQAMPTEMKLHYRVRQNRLRAQYNYELIYSNEKELLPDDVFIAWFKEVKEKQ
ncbi:DUF600 domain-containing protein [Bacillus sp. RAR_GA_16]|uniref:DUF600 domain-containing protein n=1 Tax=Bacillus sp. RAR_GA_16 TaxID=2876774 RepID=UPI001CCC5FA1|nr:DUF600 domain-containing protein [Bacillus sp. RAR_GA_16]MCA0172898.1 DUF600 domain-containing protein [Bacillus sp. RAR_GA_16]